VKGQHTGKGEKEKGGKIRFYKSQTPRPITSPRKRQVSDFFFTLYSLLKTWSDKIKPCKKWRERK